MNEHEINITQRVAKVETNLSTLDEEIKSTRRAVDTLAGLVQSGFAEIRREVSTSKVPNWGLFISGAGLIFAVGGAILVAAIRPLSMIDAYHEKAIERLEARESESFEARIRHDERIRFLEREKR